MSEAMEAGGAAAPRLTATPAPDQGGQQQQSINLICVKISWMGRCVESMDAPFHHLRVDPEPEHPKGRKGLVIASGWRQMQGPTDAGMVILDADVVIEPTDLQTMISHVVVDREAVWTAPAKIWPRSTHLPTWVWGHRRPAPDGEPAERTLQRWQQDIDDPLWFTFCFTYLPRSLVEAAVKRGLRKWHYPNVDKNMHELAAELGYKVRVVRGDCHPKHLNF